MTQEEINKEVMLAIMRLSKEILSCREVRGKHSGLRIVVTNPATMGDL